jgi:hypothetical protein
MVGRAYNVSSFEPIPGVVCWMNRYESPSYPAALLLFVFLGVVC